MQGPYVLIAHPSSHNWSLYVCVCVYLAVLEATFALSILPLNLSLLLFLKKGHIDAEGMLSMFRPVFRSFSKIRRNTEWVGVYVCVCVCW